MVARLRDENILGHQAATDIERTVDEISLLRPNPSAVRVKCENDDIFSIHTFLWDTHSPRLQF